MGRGRKGLLDQSIKKPKILKNKARNEVSIFTKEMPEKNIEMPILISEELLTQMKKTSPQDLMNALIKPDKTEEQEEQEELYEMSDLEEFVFDLIGPEEPAYERPLPTRELVEQMMTTMSKDQVRYVLEKSLAN